MTNFEAAFEYTMGHEVGGAPNGGYNVTPGDPGGATKWGISQRAHPELDIKNLTKLEAMGVYWNKYWRPLRLSEVPDRQVAMEIFDTAVNRGTRSAARIAQKACNLLNRREGRASIAVDGQIGPVSLAALAFWIEEDRLALLALLNVIQGQEYLRIVERKPSLMYALRSWMRRCLPPMVRAA